MSRQFVNRVSVLMAAVMLLSIVAIGCAQARWVERSQTEGIVAIPYNNSANREEAYKLAGEAWGPGNFDIVWEKEVPIGTTTSTHGRESERSAAVGASRTEHDGDGSTTVAGAAGRRETRSSETTTTRVDTEYHIMFRSK